MRGQYRTACWNTWELACVTSVTGASSKTDTAGDCTDDEPHE
jgi:hypothetical protein